MSSLTYRHAVQSRSPSGRFAHGPWSGPFGSSPTKSIESGPTLYISLEGQCYCDLDMGSAELALSKDASSDLDIDITINMSVVSSEEPRVNHATDLATLMGIRPGEKGAAVKPRTLKEPQTHSTRSSNNKKLRQSSKLNQPRRMN